MTRKLAFELPRDGACAPPCGISIPAEATDDYEKGDPP